MISLVTVLLGGGPEGGVTFGSLESGPLVGVVAAAPVAPASPVAPDLASASADLLSSLIPIELELLEPPQPAIRIAAASAVSRGSVRDARGCGRWKSLK